MIIDNFDPNLKIAVSTKEDGNMKFMPGGDAAEFIENRKLFLDKAGIKPEQTVAMIVTDPQQWDKITYADENLAGDGVVDPNKKLFSDALITDKPGIALFVLTADCNPVVLFDPVKKVLALVHLGWQSTVVDTAKKVVDQMTGNFKSDPSDIKAFFAPGIKAESYVKPEEFVFGGDKELINHPDWQPFLHKTDGKIATDLPGFIKQQLINAGVSSENIKLSEINTATSDDYYSHFQEVNQGKKPEEIGRFATIAMIKN